MMHTCIANWKYGALLNVALFAVALAAPAPALADVTRVVVKDHGPMGSYGGREYTWVTADMEGTVARNDGTTGHYRVPVSLMYPDRRSNGFGFVDVVNSADFAQYFDEGAPFGRRKIYYPGDYTFSDYLRREGFTYISVQWAKMATEALGPEYGIIENGTDGYEILRDAVRFLRVPDRLEGELPFRLNAVDRLVAFGHSQTSGVLKGFVQSGRNREASGSLVFDGVLSSATAECRFLTNDATPRPGNGPTNPVFYKRYACEDPFPEDGKFIQIQTQSELERSDTSLRFETPSFRRYELAGVSHIPSDFIMLRTIGAMRQNPVSFRPFYKAMLRNLVDWIVIGEEPPPPLYIQGTVDSDGRFWLATDADGNAIGGVRLPHMPTVLPNGEPAGAPLGVYGGLDPDLTDRRFGFARIGGTFEPFSAQELAVRYPTHDIYVDLVRKAAEALVADRYILEEDRDAYIRAAEHIYW